MDLRLSLKSKVWLTMAAVILFFTFFILYYFPKKQTKSLRKHYEAEIENLAQITANDVHVSLEQSDYRGMKAALSMVKVDPRFYFISLDLDTNGNGVEDHISTIYAKGVDTSLVDPRRDPDKKIIVKSADLPGAIAGKVTLGYGTDDITESILEIRYTSIIFSAFVMLIGLAVSLIFTRKITMPVSALRNAAIRVGQGDYSQQITVVGNDEIGDLGIAFNKMVTDLRSSQAQLVQSEKLASLGQLTAGIAHEINNPINFVSSNIPSLKRDIEVLMKLLDQYGSVNAENYLTSFEAIKGYAQRIDLPYTIKEINALLKGIEEGAMRTSVIVKGLRNFSRQEEELMRTANINDGLESTLVLVQHKMRHKKIVIVKQLGAVPEIQCFPNQLDQVFMNLLSNAADAIEESGEITITTALRKEHVMISVKDSGSGMNEVTMKKLFDPFFTTKPVGQGTGLGLSVSHGIIQKHNGRIEVRSEIGKGTEFIVWLPLVHDEAAEGTSPTSTNA